MDLFIRPAGPADAEAVAEVQRISWQATYARLLSAASLARVETAWDANHWRQSLERIDSAGVCLVMDGEATRVVGFGVAGPKRGKRDPLLDDFGGEFYLLYLLPMFQNQGHGVRLMSAMAKVLRARNLNSAVVWALAGNRSAIDFYEHLGGAQVLQCRKLFFGEWIDEVALVWPTLKDLAGVSRNLRR
jgi:ribosomal protein S18 acetylase RimI-like enzyme